MPTSLHTRQQVQDETQDIEGEDISNRPLHRRSNVLMASEHRAAEHNCQNDFDADEDELDPERYPQDAMVTVVNAESLVLGADTHCGDDVAADEEEEHAVVQTGVVVGVLDGEGDEAGGANEGADAGCDGETLLEGGCVAGELAVVSEPALGDEGGVKGDDHDGGAGDEEWFETEGAHVGDVGYRLLGFHRWVVRAAAGAPVDEHAEEGAEPDDSREEREQGGVAPHIGGREVVAWPVMAWCGRRRRVGG